MTSIEKKYHNPRFKVEDVVKALSFLIGVIGFLSAARHTGLAYSLGFISLFIISLLFEYRRAFLLPRRALTIATLLLIGISFLRMSLQNFVLPAVEALMILLAIKFLEEKKFRDYLQIYTLSVFLLAGSALLSLDILFLVYFFALLFLLAAAMVLLTFYAEDNTMELPLDTVRGIVLKSLYIPLLSVPLAALLFIILPRTSSPVFNFFNRGGGAATGFSDTVGLGQVSAIQEDATILMRVHMERVDDDLLYWRGIVLDSFDGASWKRSGRARPGGGPPPPLTGRRIAQTVYLEPYGNKYFFALDKPVSVQTRDVRKSSDLTYSLAGTITRKMKYEAQSVLSDTLPGSDEDLDAYLQVPDVGTAKIRELVHGIANRSTKEENAAALLRFLRDGEYQYSLNNLPVSSAPLDDFLFQHKYGNCEYFASALAVMLRLSGIPSRLVGGYRGGFYNQAGGYYMIPQRNAHVWVEAYFKNSGWVRLDPTPAALANYVSPSGRSLLFRLRLFFDAIDYYWNAAVINYDLERQFSLITKLHEGFRDVRINVSFDKKKALRYLAVSFGSGSLLVLALYVLLRARKPFEERLLAAFFRKMKRRGYAKSRAQGLEEFVALIKDDVLREKARRFVDRFEGLYYRDRKLTKADARSLKGLIREF